MSGKDEGVGLIGEIKRKLIEKKQAWAKEGRLLTGRTAEPERAKLPPGQRVTRDWPVLDLGLQPTIDPAQWKLKVDGLVEAPLEWSMADFKAQPQIDDVSDMHCVTAWSRYDNLWQGVAAKHVVALVRPKPEARFIVFHSYDGYTTNVPRAAFEDDDVLLAHSWEGKPIPREHGGPVRIILPKLYLWKSAKWVRRIEYVAADRPGFWEVRGYHNHGDPWKEERYG
ncbi:MAG: sulfite oxidase-like oxidoreductase [Alphaproteobacteria bacterium]|nr:sulfite oxidase-like oxidoreductase [Alphaproteobacteria bacterium]